MKDRFKNVIAYFVGLFLFLSPVALADGMSGGGGGGASSFAGLTGNATVSQGGTGATSLAANNVILGNGTSAVQVVAPGTSGNVLTSNGSILRRSLPRSSVPCSALDCLSRSHTEATD